jgi:hypothetical protein
MTVCDGIIRVFVSSQVQGSAIRYEVVVMINNTLMTCLNYALFEFCMPMTSSTSQVAITDSENAVATQQASRWQLEPAKTNRDCSQFNSRIVSTHNNQNNEVQSCHLRSPHWLLPLPLEPSVKRKPSPRLSSLLRVFQGVSWTVSLLIFQFCLKIRAHFPFLSACPINRIVEPTGLFDPLGFADKADEAILKRYREAELTHGRVAMLATLGFLAGEAVEGKSFLWDASVKGPAITHLSQVPPVFWALLTIGIGAAEQTRVQIGWVEPKNVPAAKPGLLRDTYVPGDIGFHPLGLKPEDPAAFKELATKKLQNGRLAMLAAAGFMAQELVNGKRILENLS